MQCKWYECKSETGRTQVVSGKTSIKMYELEPSSKSEINNGFANDYT